MKVQVKICGIRSLESAQSAIEGGADFIGFNFIPSSKRYIDPDVCRKIINHTRGKISIVGVFKNTPFEKVNSIAIQLGLDYVQLHGDEDDDYMKKIERPIIKSIHRLQRIKSKQAQFLLLDRLHQGHGKMVNFIFAKDLAEKNEIFFAGGLTPGTVASIIKNVKPFAVDVASGVETNGKEDLKKIVQFIANAKGVTI